MRAPSVPYLLSQAVVEGLGTAPDLAGAVVIDNPTDPSHLSEGERVVFVEDATDAPVNQPGQAEGRTFTFRVGVINRGAAARADADADMEAVRASVRASALAACQSLRVSARLAAFNAPREGLRGYRVEGIDVGGALVFTTFEIDYRTPAVR